MVFRRSIDSPPWGLASMFGELDRMRRQIDEMFGNWEGRPFGFPAAGVFPLINLTEDRDNFYVRAELPGLQADDINISATGNNLTIAGERKIPPEGEDVRYHRREREAGTFNRIIALPGEVDADRVEANHVNGILTVVIPKAEKAKPKQIPVQ